MEGVVRACCYGLVIGVVWSLMGLDQHVVIAGAVSGGVGYLMGWIARKGGRTDGR